MFNTEYTVTHDQLSDILQFPRGDDMRYRLPHEVDWTAAAFGFWSKISGETTDSWEDLYASHIHNPTIRYFF